ncbi:MAG TPA: aminoacyl-tRNA deacylase [Usitatibacter sp.]|jgi:Cys-tRNA(Pro) deacylase|nr:aminoacyl-tRNA deacylase [Usitatibacter sp.]
MKGAATPATEVLAREGVDYSEHSFEYVEHGGTSASSSALGVPEHHVVKTLVMETERGDPLIVLMHGDRKVSTKELARRVGTKRIFPCKPEVAQRHSGYLVGGTSPFGTRRHMPVYLERSVLDLPRIYINGGRRGYLLGMDAAELARVLSPVLVDVALEE